MRFETLRVECYGHFRELALSFPAPAEGQGFHVLLGSNEAGKTTLLSAIHALLFGFPERSDYDFRYEYPKFRVAAEVRMRDGEALRLERRKARGHASLTGARGRGEGAVDGAWLEQRLGASREVYERLYGFSLAELARGQELLKGATMREALFGAGLGGGARVHDVLEQLQEEAEGLYTSKSRTKPVDRLLQRIDDLEKQRRDALLRPEEYEDLVARLGAAEGEAEEIAAAVARLEEEARACGRLARALPLRRRADDLLERATALEAEIPADFPRDGASRYEDLLAEAARLREERAKAATDVARREARLAETVVDRDLLARGVEIRALHADLGRVRGERDQIPHRENDIRKLRDEIATDLAALRPGWGLERLGAFPTDQAATQRLRDLVREETSLREERLGAEQRLRDRALRIAGEERRLAELGPAEDASALEGLIADWPTRQAEARRLRVEEADLEKLRLGEAVARGRLAPALPDECLLRADLPLPSPARVQAFERRFRLLEEQETQSRADAAAQASRKAQLESDLRAQHSEEIPNRDDLRALRERRDALWAEVRAAGAPGEDLATAYEGAVAEADAYADALFEHAEAVTKKEQCRRQLEDARVLEESHLRRLAELAEERAAAQAEWAALFAGCGVAPDPPAAMQPWIAEVRALIEARLARESRDAEAARLRLLLEGYERELRALLQDEKVPLERLAKRAEDVVGRARAREAERERLNESIRLLEEERRADEAAVADLERREAEFGRRRAAFLRTLGFDETDLTTEAIQEIVNGLRTQQEKQRVAEPDLERRIEAMKRSIAGFEASARELCAAVAPDLAGEDAPTAVGRLAERLDLATRAEAQHEETVGALEAAREELATRGAALEAREAELLGLRSAARAEDDEGVRELGRRLADLTGLTRELDDVRGKLSDIRDRTDHDAFDAALERALEEGADAEQLAERASEREQSAAEEQLRLRETHQTIGRLKGELSACDGSSRAAEVQAEIESARSELRKALERYATVTVARTLLHGEMERFQRENQPEVLDRAGRIFAAMTDGRYTSLGLAPGPSGEVLAIRQGADALEQGLPFAALSTGTGQQLYLALRLAYVARRAEATEPLPLIMDDVLVNFDDDRARATLRALLDLSRDQQVLFLTCHPHLVALAREAMPEVAVAHVVESGEPV